MKNGFQTQNNNVNPTAEQIKRRNKLHKEATKQADKSFSAACKAVVRLRGTTPGINPRPTDRRSLCAASHAHLLQTKHNYDGGCLPERRITV
jgi:hypothetical protein